MFGKNWKTSELKYKVLIERGVKIRMSDGTELNADIFRPDSNEKFPAIFGFHPYDQASQTAPITINSLSTNFFKLPGQEKGNAFIEAGDPNAYVRRGYVYVIASIRGTGKSGRRVSVPRRTGGSGRLRRYRMDRPAALVHRQRWHVRRFLLRMDSTVHCCFESSSS